VVAVAAGETQRLALKSDGTVWAWGANSEGELGNNSTTDSSVPVQVVSPGGKGTLSGIIAIAADGFFGSVALKSDGTVWAWGFNNAGQLGDNSTATSLVPVQVVGPGGQGTLTGITAIAAGGQQVLALKSNGSVWAWGDNQSGELGNGAGNSGVTSSTPVQVVGSAASGTLSGVSEISAGNDYSLALKSDGSVWSWGGNRDGELGIGTFTGPATCGTFACSTTPVQVGQGGTGALSGVTQIAAGSEQPWR
jgi:alpha-tubulin suppressor-like RCC1 family protein